MVTGKSVIIADNYTENRLISSEEDTRKYFKLNYKFVLIWPGEKQHTYTEYIK